jgi:hypothetical protein
MGALTCFRIRVVGDTDLYHYILKIWYASDAAGRWVVSLAWGYILQQHCIQGAARAAFRFGQSHDALMVYAVRGN